MTLAAPTDTTPRCCDCGTKISKKGGASNKKPRRCVPCSIIENRRVAATRHKQTAHSWRAVSRPPKRDTGGHQHFWILPPGAGLGSPYTQRCKTCGESVEVEA